MKINNGESSNLRRILFAIGLLENKEYEEAEKVLKELIVNNLNDTLAEYTNSNAEIGSYVEESLKRALKRLGEKSLPR